MAGRFGQLNEEEIQVLLEKSSFRVLKTMNSISEECYELKKSYDVCFNTWYTEKFLRGETKSEPCRKLFESYRACVVKALKDKNISIEEVEKDVLGTHNEKKAPDSHATDS